MQPENTGYSGLRRAAFYTLLASIILAPLAFWSTQYFALEAVKTVVIGVLTTVSLILVLLASLKEKELKLPPRSMVSTSLALLASLIVSASLSGNFMKSFFGQGFEIGAASFILTVLVAGYVAYYVTVKRREGVIILYTGMAVAFIILWLFHATRYMTGPEFATLGILRNITSTVLGSWFAFGMFAAIVSVVSLVAIMALSPSSKMKIAYWLLFAVSAVTVFLVNSIPVWAALALTFLGLSIYFFTQRPKVEGSRVGSFFSRMAWIPVICFVFAAVMSVYSEPIPGKVVERLKLNYAELYLPWQMTIDVASGELKTNPLFGAGPNRFGQSYIAHKPFGINGTDLWSIEFTNGFGIVPSYLITQGFIGGLIWVIFFIFFGILGVKSLRGFMRPGGTGDAIAESERPYARFILLSSFSAASCLWLITLFYVPTHVILFYTFVMTGIWLGAAVSYGRLTPITFVKREGTISYKFLPVFMIVLLVVSLGWGFTHLKNAAALAYFGKGLKALKVDPINPELADKSFATASSLNPVDIYLQARAESTMALATKVASQITATSTASTSQALILEAANLVNKAMEYATAAVKSDPADYNNYISQARVSELGIALRMDKAYENATNAYMAAIQTNPQNPAIYLSLGRLQATLNDLDRAIQTIGAALQVKNNYLDAVYLLSQVEAAKGNVQDAITAAEYAAQLNPNNALLHFQLGLLEYSRGNYQRALEVFTKAVSLEPVYANAKYFQGLSFARVGDNASAIAAFEELLKTNEGNQDVEAILTILRSGKSLFAAPTTVSAARPEKKSTPPISEPQR